MYEARQNKEKVSRRIEKNRKTKQMEKSINKQKSIHFISPTNRNILMRFAIGPSSSEEIKGPFGQKANICTSNKVRLDSYDNLNQLYKAVGSRPQWPAKWAGWLLDEGNGKNATQCHVINQNFGGSGKHLDHNLHPGSQTLNHYHETQMEDVIKTVFENNVKGKEGTHLEFTCNFQPSFNTNVPLSVGQHIDDPTITGFYSIHDSSKQPKHIEIGSFSISSITKGPGGKATRL